MAKRTRKGQKQCPKCDAWVKGTRAKNCPKCGHGFTAAKAKKAARQTVTVPAEVPTKPSYAVTLEQITAVGQMVKTIGGFRHLHEMLAVIKEVGGLKKFKDLLDAIAVSGVGETEAVSSTLPTGELVMSARR